MCMCVPSVRSFICSFYRITEMSSTADPVHTNRPGQATAFSWACSTGGGRTTACSSTRSPSVR